MSHGTRHWGMRYAVYIIFFFSQASCSQISRFISKYNAIRTNVSDRPSVPHSHLPIPTVTSQCLFLHHFPMCPTLPKDPYQRPASSRYDPNGMLTGLACHLRATAVTSKTVIELAAPGEFPVIDRTLAVLFDPYAACLAEAAVVRGVPLN